MLNKIVNVTVKMRDNNRRIEINREDGTWESYLATNSPYVYDWNGEKEGDGAFSFGTRVSKVNLLLDMQLRSIEKIAKSHAANWIDGVVVKLDYAMRLLSVSSMP